MPAWLQAPLATPGLIAAALLATGFAFALEEASRRLPAALGWQLDEQTRIHRRAPWWVLVSAIATWLAALAHRHDSTTALVAGTATLVLCYLSATDMRDRWLPDHATHPLIIAGLLASPLAPQWSRVDAMAINWAIVVTWQIAMAPLTGRKLDAETFSGGDQAFAAAIGAWLGIGAGQKALAAGAIAMLLAMTLIPKPNRPTTKLARALGFDPETRTFPVGAYFAAAFWLFLVFSH